MISKYLMKYRKKRLTRSILKKKTGSLLICFTNTGTGTGNFSGTK